jgi:two-component system nitrogen regulation response regulator GlnG
MLVATSNRERNRSMLPYVLRASANREEIRSDESEGWTDSSSQSSVSSKPTTQLLVIGEDLRAAAQQLQTFFEPTHTMHFADTGTVGLEHVRSHGPDIILLGLRLPDRCGLQVHQEIRDINGRIPVIFVTGATRGDVTIQAMRQGAYDCLFQPLHLPTLQRVVDEALEVARLMRQPAPAEPVAIDSDAECGMVGCCPAMTEVYKSIGRVTGQNVPVLITGESGTGKELVARAIYLHGPRAKAPFLALNCAAIPENLLESELFGHEKGAFTGADRRRIGKFEQCHGGTIFLDEIGDMPLALQAKILRLLQEQTFERVGGNDTIRTDVRLIAATHRDLKASSAAGTFRSDLYYRLSVFTIHLPPLRERGDDLPLLVRYYLGRFSRELGREVRQVAPEVMERLRGYAWPGNIRELQSVLKQALLQASGPVLLPTFIPKLFGEPVGLAPVSPTTEGPGVETFVVHQRLGSGARDVYAETHRQLDRMFLARVLKQTAGNLQQAARLLGIARQTLRLRLRDLGLSVLRNVESEEDNPA